MRPKRRAYKNARYDMLRRLGCCTVCGECDERTRNGGALFEKCLLERRRKPPTAQISLPLSGKQTKALADALDKAVFFGSGKKAPEIPKGIASRLVQTEEQEDKP